MHFLSKCNHDFSVLDLLSPSHVKNISIPHLPDPIETAANSWGIKCLYCPLLTKGDRWMPSPSLTVFSYRTTKSAMSEQTGGYLVVSASKI